MPQKKNAECYELNPCAGHYGKCLDVKITNDCNGRCAYCIERNGFKPRPAPIDVLIEATNALEDYRKVLILGGEPFLCSDLSKYLEGIRGKDEIYITTNGSSFSKQPLSEIGRHLTGINITIHHHTQAINSQSFGMEIDFRSIREAVTEMKRKDVRVRINSNLAKSGITCQYDMLKMIGRACELGADEIRFTELQNCPEEFISAYPVFEGQLSDKLLPKEPYQHGCERIISDNGIRVIVRLTCGFVNPARRRPASPYRRGSKTKVLYPNGEVYDGWRPVKPAEAEISPSCH